MVDALSGFVRYKVTYNALMFRPFKHEVLDAVVKSVSEVGFFAEAGPLSILVSHAHIPEDMAYAPARERRQRIHRRLRRPSPRP